MQRDPYESEYGPNNEYMVAPYDPSQAVWGGGYPTMPPRDRNLVGAAMGGALSAGGGFALAGAPPIASLGAAAVGAPLMMGYEALEDYFRRSGSRAAYNNEYSGMQERPLNAMMQHRSR